MRNRRQFIKQTATVAGLGLASPLARALHPKGRRPNVVFFLVDDLGWGDLGCYGNKYHETPNIDRLASEGLKFTNAYAGAPVCSPSRAAILTGQAPARLQLTQWIPGTVFPHKKLLEPPTPSHLAAQVPTIAERLRQLGYTTAAIGKWHLGGEGYLPQDFGFDLNIAGDFHGRPGLPNHYFGPFHYPNLTGYSTKDYLTDVLTQKMDEYLARIPTDQPFFLYMAEYAVHIPLQARKALTAKYLRKDPLRSTSDAVYAAMAESVDTALGSLRATLARRGLAENTIIILTSDNGGVGFQERNLKRIADNGPLRAGKGFLYEGGIREPLIVSWPGETRANSTCDIPVIGTDFMPTILGIVGGGSAPNPCDGLDVSALFRGSKTLNRETLYWHYPHYSDQGGTPTGAIREGEWKLIEFFEDGHLELYNLSLDPGEQYNFASSFADRAVDLQNKLHRWRESVGARMPRPNPAYSATDSEAALGPRGCSWDPVPGCRED